MSERENVRFFRVPGLPGLELMVARDFRFLWRTFRTAYEVVLMESGGARWRLGSRQYRSGRGSVYLVAPGDFHVGIDVDKASSFSSLLVPEAFVNDPNGKPLRFRTNQLDDPRVTRAAARLMRIVAAGQSWNIEAEICEFFGRIAELAGDGDPWADDAGLERVAHVRAHLLELDGETPSLETMASRVGWSRYQLIRAFKRHLGVTPFAYLTQVRIARAADLLRTGRSAVDVANEAGFSDQSHLIRWFRRSMRVTPSRYFNERARLDWPSGILDRG